MAEKSGVYLPGTEAAKAYDEALQGMLQSLERRKTPLFDPTLLSIAAGAAKPTQTGGYGEMLGNVAQSLYGEQERARKEEEQIAATKLEIASRGLGIEQQRQRERAFNAMMGLGEDGQVAAPAGRTAPAGGLPSAGGVSAAPPGFQGVQGIQVSEPSLGFADSRKYLGMARLDPSISPAEAMKNAQEMESKRYQTKEGGVLDLGTGMFYPFPKGELVERQIYGEGEGKTYKVDQRTAALLDLYASTNDPKYFEVANRVLRGPTAPGAQAGERIKSVQEKEAEQKETEARVGEVGKEAGKKEAAVDARDQSARMIYANAEDVKRRLAQSPTYFGIFSRPNIVSAIGNLVNEGFKAGNTSVNLGGFEQTILQMMPGIKQEDLNNVMAAAGSLAEIELAYTNLYLRGGGQITEGERAIVRRIPGTTSSSPQVLKDKMDLMGMRSQYDMDIAQAWRDWKEQNPGKGYNVFERSKEYKELTNGFQDALAQRFKTQAAVPTKERKRGDYGSWVDRLGK